MAYRTDRYSNTGCFRSERFGDLRDLGLLDLSVLTASGAPLGDATVAVDKLSKEGNGVDVSRLKAVRQQLAALLDD